MKEDVQIFIDKLYDNHNQKRLWKKIISILSCITIFITICFFTKTAITETSNKTYNFYLIDSYTGENYSWKTTIEGEYTTSYTLDLYFVDTNGNYLEGKDLNLTIGPNDFEDNPYGFGYVPLSSTTSNEIRGQNLIDVYNLTEYTLQTGEKYIFDHAEVSLDGGVTWNSFVSGTNSTSTHWNIWCQNSSSQTKPSENSAGYGWRGNYEFVTGENTTESKRYEITENTAYKLVFKLVRKGINDSVSSLGADSGISFNIYNYSGDNTESGVNANGLYDYFSFRDSTLKDPVKINAQTDADGFISTRAKVKSTLDSNGYPVFDCQGYCNNDSSITNTSLGYLFGSKTNALGTNTLGVESYQSTNTPLQKENLDGVDYYYYNSNRNAVDYDTENNRFMVRNYLERGYIITTYENELNRYEFLPFNYYLSDTSDNYNYESAEDKTEIDHWYGMTMEFEFYMPSNGKINDQDMIFTFSGDDDVWVFIDNVLVLDLGGTHGSVDGSINFSSGEVISYLNWNGIVGTTENGTKNITSIYEMFNNANATDNVIWNSNKTTFKNYTKHTLKFFYLERGAAVANCKIRFNIPVLPSGSLSVQKQYLGEDNYHEDYEFTLYDVTSGSPSPASFTAYTIEGNTYYTDEFGKFDLKTKEEAIFKLTNEHTYYLEETNSGVHSVSYECSFDGLTCPEINKTNTFTINPDSSYQAVFTNAIKKYDLTVSKAVYGETESNETFEFQINLSKSDKVIDIPDDPDSKYLVNHDKGIVTFNLKNKESITIKDIPVDTSITLKEIKHDGYKTIIKSGEETLSNEDTYTFILTGNKNITVHNIPGITLPKTGGSKTWRYLLTGISLILISIKFRYKFICNLKEGED